ncbi:MAG: hypothetical protein OEM91_18375, partial [Hyphomicrobiales bacterium]|nr:hypothetical protein [Hyphomicrobiales bacterium]
MFKALVLFGDNSIDGTGANRFAADYAGSVAGIVRQSCSEMDVAAFADDVHSLALIIAGASGGLFGIGSKISDVEREAIAELNAVFAARPASRSARINPARFAFAWAGTFERLFSDTLGIPADSLEIAAYVASILDFCLQANASPAEYKRQIESVVRALAERNRIPSDKLAQLVGERAEAYVGLTLNAIRSIHRQQH